MPLDQSLGIRAAVGSPPFATNDPADVRNVKRLLNEHASRLGFAAFADNGDVSPGFIEAIKKYQGQVVGMKSPDGRVDPGGKTIGSLNGSAEAPAKAQPRSGKVPAPPEGQSMAWDPATVASANAAIIQFALAKAGNTAQGTCSRSVGNAINAGLPPGWRRIPGIVNERSVVPYGNHADTQGPASGGEMGPVLEKVGYVFIKRVVGIQFDLDFPLQPGDVIVVKSVVKSTGAPHDGHVAIWTGNRWVSDFKQGGGRDPNPYSSSGSKKAIEYSVYRLGG
ncbi:MAG: hypothetical protein U0790_00705 [Isosphaeraceae bacterium]